MQRQMRLEWIPIGICESNSGCGAGAAKKICGLGSGFTQASCRVISGSRVGAA